MTRDAEGTEAPRKFMTRTFVARMIAILLFVALGTFAVFQSIQGDLRQAGLTSGSSAAQPATAAAADPGKTVDAAALTATLKATPASTEGSRFPASQSNSVAPAPHSALPNVPSNAPSANQPKPDAPVLPRFNPAAPNANPSSGTPPANVAPALDKPVNLPPTSGPGKPNQAVATPATESPLNPASGNPVGSGQTPANPRLTNPAIPDLARPVQPQGFAPGTVQVPASFPSSTTAPGNPNSPPANSSVGLGGMAAAELANSASQARQQPGDAPGNSPATMSDTLRSTESDAARLLQQVSGQPANLQLPAKAPGNIAADTPALPPAPSNPGSMLPSASQATSPSGNPAQNPAQPFSENPLPLPGRTANPGPPTPLPGNQPATGFNLQTQPTRPNQLPGQPATAPPGGLPGHGFESAAQSPGLNNLPGTRPGAIPAAPASSQLNQPGLEPASPAPGRTLIPGASPQQLRTLATPGEARLEGTQTPSLAIEKQAPREIQLNQPAEFRIIVRNTGQVPASDVRVFDTIPAGTRLISSDPRHETAGAADGLMWPLGELQPGDEKTITLKLQPERPGEIGSVAQVTFATQASMRTRVTQPKISIEHTAPAQVMIGEPVPLQITVRNNGDGPATNVVIQEKVPEQFRYSEGIRDLEYEIGTLAPGQSRAVTLTLQAIAVGATRNVVGAIADGGLQTSHETPVEVVSPKLVAACDGPNRRFLKRSAAHTFTVQNAGTASASNVDLIAKLPRNIRFVAANNQGQYDPGSHAVYWSLAELRAGQSATVELESEPVETGSVQLEFIARADLDQQSAIQHPLTIEHLVDVHFEIEDLTDHIEVGAVTEYRLRLVNQGTRPATNVRLRAELADGLRAEAVSGGLRGAANGQEVLFEPIPNINPGEEITAVFSAVGTAPGEHRVAVNLQTDGREINITKEESTRVYADQ